MALEASDLNDGTILQQTKQNTDARGNIQFEITLPSGRKLTSEFLSKDNARKALFAWIETVKEQAVADSNAERLERAAKSKRQGKMDIEHRPGDDQPLFRAGGARVEDKPRDTPEALGAAAFNGVPTGTIPDQDYRIISPNMDYNPLEFAKAQHQIQASRVAELKDAEHKLRQWSVIIETLEENGSDFD